MSLRYVTIKKFAADSGYSAKAIRVKIERGVWIEGRQYRRAPDGRLMVDVDAVARWIEGTPAHRLLSGQ